MCMGCMPVDEPVVSQGLVITETAVTHPVIGDDHFSLDRAVSCRAEFIRQQHCTCYIMDVSINNRRGCLNNEINEISANISNIASDFHACGLCNDRR